jgi:hypothetical protein
VPFVALSIIGPQAFGLYYQATGRITDYAGMTADADGSFHPDWIDFRTGVGQIWTSTIDVSAIVPSTNSANVPQSTSYMVHLLKVTHAEHDVYALDIQLTGPADHLQQGVYLQAGEGFSFSKVHDVTFLNADNGLGGKGARWLFKLSTTSIANGQTASEVRRILLHVPNQAIWNAGVGQLFAFKVLDQTR